MNRTQSTWVQSCDLPTGRWPIILMFFGEVLLVPATLFGAMFYVARRMKNSRNTDGGHTDHILGKFRGQDDI